MPFARRAAHKAVHSPPAEARAGDLAPIARADRSLAPDIARGLLLMFIAIANTPGFHMGLTGPKPKPLVVDRIVDGIETVFVVDRSRPMFAVLFGFGIAMMASRLAARGVDQRGVRRVLRRRSWWLVLFGLVHATLLWRGDILAPYGVTGLVALWLVHRPDAVLRRWFWASLVWSSIAFPGIQWLDGGSAPSTTWKPLSYLEFMREGVITSGLMQFLSLGTFLLLPMTIVGIWLHRSGWLTRPHEHVAELRTVFVTALVVNVVLSLPDVLMVTRVWDLSRTGESLVYGLHLLLGAMMGAGYVCGFALLAVRWSHRGRTGLPGVLAAVGERSMTAYLLQSVLFFSVLTGWGLGLGTWTDAAWDTVIAVVVWSVIAVGMVALDRRGVRGPAEVVLRALTYRGERRRLARAAAPEAAAPEAEVAGPLSPGDQPWISAASSALTVESVCLPPEREAASWAPEASGETGTTASR